MKIILDERETHLYEHVSKLQSNYPTTLSISKKVLLLGDIEIQTDEGITLTLLERKTFPDLLASIKDGRYNEQAYRLRHTSNLHLHNVVYVIEGIQSQLKSHEKKIALGAMVSVLMFKGFSVIRTTTLQDTAEFILTMADKLHRELFEKSNQLAYSNRNNTTENILVPSESIEKKDPTSEEYCEVVKKSKKENLIPENMGQIILTQIPGVSSTIAMSLMAPFHSFREFYDHVKLNPDYITNSKLESGGKSRKMGKNVIENIQKFLF